MNLVKSLENLNESLDYFYREHVLQDKVYCPDDSLGRWFIKLERWDWEVPKFFELFEDGRFEEIEESQVLAPVFYGASTQKYEEDFSGQNGFGRFNTNR